jgi:hypothetical protein
LKSERDTLEKGFLPIPAFSSVAAVGRTAAKTWPSAGPGKNRQVWLRSAGTVQTLSELRIKAVNRVQNLSEKSESLNYRSKIVFIVFKSFTLHLVSFKISNQVWHAAH